MNNNPTNNSKTKQVVYSLVSILVLVAVAIGVRLLFQNVFSPSKSEQVSQFVEKSKENLKVPAKIDQYTTLSDIKADGEEAAVLEYSVTGLKASDISKDQLKKSAAATECADKGGREALDADITLRHHYVFDGSADTLDYDVTKADCA